MTLQLATVRLQFLLLNLVRAVQRLRLFAHHTWIMSNVIMLSELKDTFKTVIL